MRNIGFRPFSIFSSAILSSSIPPVLYDAHNHLQDEPLDPWREQILATASGQSFDKVAKDSDRDFYLNAEEAIAYGLADKIVEKI